MNHMKEHMSEMFDAIEARNGKLFLDLVLSGLRLRLAGHLERLEDRHEDVMNECSRLLITLYAQPEIKDRIAQLEVDIIASAALEIHQRPKSPKNILLLLKVAAAAHRLTLKLVNSRRSTQPSLHLKDVMKDAEMLENKFYSIVREEGKSQ